MRHAFLYCLRVFVAVRVALFLLGLAGLALLPANDPAGVPGWPAPPSEPGWQGLFTSWERWDALWFLRIADDGYRLGDGSAAFFPLYPIAVRVVSALLGGHPLAAALIVSNAAYLAAMVVVYRLSAYEFDDRRARSTVVLMSLFPTALFFFAPYSESLFLLLAAGSLYAARTDRWAAAGVLGALAALSRAIGLVLAVALAAEAVRRHLAARDGRAPELAGRVGCAALVVAGAAVYLWFWEARAGDPLAPFSDQARWQRTFSPLPATLWSGTVEAWRGLVRFPGAYHAFDWVIVVVVLGLAVWVARRAALPHSLYVWGSLLVPLSFVFESRPLMSMPRFAVVLFPLFWAMDDLASSGRARDAAIAVSAGGLALATLLFVNWYWIF